MKKTSTRLITIGLVLATGAFAIALAQHDARNREREEPTTNAFASEASNPIAVEGNWDQRGALNLVRANNDEFAEGESSEMPDGFTSQGFTQDSGSTFDGDLAAETTGNPLRDPVLVSQTQRNSYQDSSEVIRAAAESPAERTALEPPSWLGDDTGTLPNLPSTDAGALEGPEDDEGGGSPLAALPTLPTFPTTPPATASNTPPPSAQQFPKPNSQLPSSPQPNSPQPNSPQPKSLGTGDVPQGQGIPEYDSLPGAPPQSLPAVAASQQRNLSAAPAPIGQAALSDMPGAANYALSDNAAAQSNRFSDQQTPSNPSAAARQPGSQGRKMDMAGVGQSIGGTASGNSADSLVSNQPGHRHLDGSQNPIMLIQKRAPEEIQVGKKATFVIVVRNAGNATAHEVTVVDSVPRGARFDGTSPNVTPSADGLLTWKLGEMAAGDERTISLQIVPEVQGEVGSVASVHFVAQASVRTVATLPKIEVTAESQPDVLIGGAQSVIVTIKNTGTGVARNVRLEADIPAQLRHESGESQLDAPIGDIRPHEVIQQTLTAAAVLAGQSKCVFRAVSDDGIQAEESVPVDVRAPALQASIQGPRLRYLERQATYRITVENTGTAAATDLDFVIRLPAGLKYISTSVPQSHYDPNTHAVNLGLEELPAGRPAPIDITVLPVELGPQVITFAATGALGANAEAKSQVMVDGLAELAFTIGQDNGTIETGASSTYSVQVTNVGNKPDKDVQLLVQLPAGTELVDVDAPGVNYQVDGNKLLFAAIPEMKNKDQRTFRFELRHNQAGNQVVRTQLTSQNWPVAVVKEEGTLVYDDQN